MKPRSGAVRVATTAHSGERRNLRRPTNCHSGERRNPGAQWIPAFAGMTKKACAGMTKKAFAGMTKKGYAGMTKACALLLASLLSTGCVTSTVDEMVFNEPTAGIGDATVVILGRRHASDYETEPDFIECVGDHISGRDKSIEVIDEIDFINALYPWFEPRTAPLHPGDIDRLLEQEPVAQRMRELKTEYMIWIDGVTVRSDSAGSMTCGIGPGGAGCFGFGTWSNDSNYEAVIWDFTDRAEVGRVNTSASGQSYMPAVVVPIPIIAPVQGTACDGIGDQLLEFLSSEY